MTQTAQRRQTALVTSSEVQPPKLLDRLRDAIRTRHYSLRTEEAYVGWVRRFILFHRKRHPAEMGEAEINQFLTHLAVTRDVSASTQNQALSGILFLYQQVLEKDLGPLEGLVRAKKPLRLPVVLGREEVRALVQRMPGTPRLVGLLLYGAGLRLMEALRLRVKDVDFITNQITVREGKGQKDRITMLPTSVKAGLMEHLEHVRKIHQDDIGRGVGRVYLPEALVRKISQCGT